MGNRNLLSICYAVVSFVMEISSLAPAFGQGQAPPVVLNLPSDSELDAMLAARDWKGLGAALGQPAARETIARKLNWLEKHTLDGSGGFLVAFVNAGTLWAVGDALKSGDPNTDMRITAGLNVLYAYELILIDGAKCDDRSAPNNRAAQLFMKRAATLAFLKTQAAELKVRMIDMAIALERRTASVRKDDDLLCRDGLDQMKAGLARGTQQSVPTPPGQIGKAVAVTAPSDWVPKFVAPSVYGPMQDKARYEMREKLLKIVE